MANNIYVIGCGSIGGFFGVRLAERYDVRFVEKNPDFVEKINREGFRIKAKDGELVRKIRIMHTSDMPRDENGIYFVAVKQYDSEEASKLIPEKNNGILFMQNGYNDNLRMDNAAFGVMGVTHKKHDVNYVEQLCGGNIYVGNFHPMNGVEARTYEVLQRAGIPAVLSHSVDEFFGYFWSKMCRNSTSNPLTALTGKSFGELLRDRKSAKKVLAVYKESMRVAQAAIESKGGNFGHKAMNGVNHNEFKIFERAGFLPFIGNLIREVAHKRFREVRTSMSDDITRGSQTEVDYINGYVARKAREMGMRAPNNEHIVELVHKVEQGRLKQGLENLDGIVS